MKNIPVINVKPNLELFLDLDGVMASFDARVIKLSGKHPKEFLRSKDLWNVVMGDKDFFLSLELMPDADDLWRYCKQYHPTFLTGAPPGDHTKAQKRLWVEQKFGPEYITIVLPKREKQLYAGPLKVLVDDTKINIDQWIAAGGIGILHKDVWDTISQLEDIRRWYKHA
jgi:hypothetical protein